MINVKAIKDQVLLNCSISDAKYAGLYSVCGLVLRLRDLYKWEKELAPWIERDPAEILDWIGDKETSWDHVAEEDYAAIKIGGKTFDPFDTVGINALLGPLGIFYGAGYGRSLKPTFLLAEIEQRKTVEGFDVCVVGRELARDLYSVPAFVQDDCIIVRMHAARTFLWDNILYVRASGKQALAAALQGYGLDYRNPGDVKPHLNDISKAESEILIRHELGELKTTDFDRDVWREIIAAWPHTPIELLARAIKDLLADTGRCGTLRQVIKERRTSSLGFYVAFMDSLSKKLFPSLTGAFEHFLETRDWSLIAAAVSAGYQNAQKDARLMMQIFAEAKQKDDYLWAEEEITRQLLKPLGILR